ncbi:MAG: tRNA (adenosine(37)-N6)-threonylcarbamoyltransferase complex dimerization subunit type 1 TsaB [Longimicrobiales bacterium]
MILAFDTSGPIGSVAVAHEGDVLARGLLRVQTGHASGLVPMIDQVLQEAGVDRGELTGLVVGEGPGSFTAKGLSRALTLPVWPVSSLAAAALAVDEGAVRYALFDARAERVYGACYGVGGARIQTLVPPHAGELREVLDGDVPSGVVFVGDASERHRAVIEGAGFPVVDSGSDVSLADGLIRFWAAHPDGFGPVDDPGAWEPEYVRASSAERLWR